MSNRYLSKKAKTRKGISPVIATVILVAVAVVIAAALAGFSSSLFGSYSQSAQISIRSLTLDTDGEGIIEMVNKGGAAETVVGVSVTNFGAADAINEADGTSDPIVPANGEATIHVSGLDDTMTAGQTVTATVTTQGGQSYTISTTVQDDVTVAN